MPPTSVSYLVLVLVLFVALVVPAQGQFNIFRDYDRDAPVKPPSYAKQNTAHSIDEYMTDSQKMMRDNRHGPITKTNAMGQKWSGFDEWNRFTKLRGNAAAAASAEVVASRSQRLRSQSLRTQSAPLASTGQGVNS